MHHKEVESVNVESRIIVSLRTLGATAMEGWMQKWQIVVGSLKRSTCLSGNFVLVTLGRSLMTREGSSPLVHSFVKEIVSNSENHSLLNLNLTFGLILALYDNVVTFRLTDAALTFPTPELSHSW